MSESTSGTPVLALTYSRSRKVSFPHTLLLPQMPRGDNNLRHNEPEKFLRPEDVAARDKGPDKGSYAEDDNRQQAGSGGVRGEGAGGQRKGNHRLLRITQPHLQGNFRQNRPQRQGNLQLVRPEYSSPHLDIYDWKEKHSEESLSSDKFPANSVSLEKEKSRQNESESSSCARCCWLFVILLIQMAQEGYLHIWGKNYPNPLQLRQKVLLAAAGENHVVFTTCTQQPTQHLATTGEQDQTASVSWAWSSHSFTTSQCPSSTTTYSLPFSAAQNTPSSSMVHLSP